MANTYPKFDIVLVDRIFLDLENPRHKPYQSQAEVIEYLCREEEVYPLAKDIARLRLNPMELFALLPGTGQGKTQTYVVAEGNRRMCAVMLLHDPELAPAKYRKDFKNLAKGAQPITEVRAVVFEDRESVAIWLERIHGGHQGGIGRRQWSTDQKTRHLGDRKNVLAQVVLDYAVNNGFLSATDRKGRLTTAQRYLGNAMLREAMGIDSSNLEDISRNRPKPDFDQMIKKFVKDLVDDKVNSRSNSDKIIEYSRELGSMNGISTQRIAAESLIQGQSTGRTKRRRKTPPQLTAPRFLGYSHDVREKLRTIPSWKLESLYHSLCSVELANNTPLLSIGVWAFFESLTAKVGRDGGNSFESFLNKSRLQSLGFAKGDEVKTILETVERISKYGNTTKHHEDAANFNGTQLHNDMETLTPLVAKLVDQAQQTK